MISIIQKINLFFFCLALCYIGIHTAHAQDVHFSQNYATPQFLNPAMTGLMGGDVRASAVYRSQWGSILPGSAFRTITASADLAFQGASEYDRLAVGFLFYNDRGGELAFSTNYFDLAFAYNLGVSENAYISLGVQGGLTNRSLDLSNAQFGSQFDGTFNPDLPSGELMETQSVWRTNVAGGLMFYVAPNHRTNFYLGGGMYHITRPDLSLTGITPDQRMSKISLQTGGSLGFGNMGILPSVYYVKQGPHSKIDAGSFLRFIFSYDRRTQLERAFNIGGFIRMADGGLGLGSDALVIAAKLDYDNISVGLSYDMTLSNVATNGGFEIALIYTTQRRQRSKMMNCPRF